jgi:hypothetical protein
MRVTLIAVCLICASLLPACSSQQAYGTAQGWQRNQCERLPGKDDRDRCMSRAGSDYDSYAREAGATAK